jgi:septal ring factor EnvC (AmiA/AmiB activator)
MKSWLLVLALLPAISAQSDPRRELSQTKVEEREVLSELSSIEERLYEATREMKALEEQVEALEGTRAGYEAELARVRAALAERSAGLSTRLKMLYRLNRSGFLRVLFSAEDPADLRRRTKYLVAILLETRSQIQDYLDKVGEQREALEQLEDNRGSILKLRGEVEDRQRALSQEKASRERLLKEIRSRRELALQELAERARSGRDLDGQLQVIDLTPESQPSAPAQGLRDQRGRLEWPVSGRLMNSFGVYTDPRTGERAERHGIDIRADLYTPARCVGDGYVQYAGFIDAYGLTVVVNHDPAHATVYANLNQLNVSEGQVVRRGEVLGVVGETGVTDGGGPRLHFEVRYNQTPQDPLTWLGPK